MKNNFTQIFFLLVMTLNADHLAAAVQPPPPPAPPPVGLPIDGGIVVFFFIALIIGYFITQKIYNKKTPY